MGERGCVAAVGAGNRGPEADVIRNVKCLKLRIISRHICRAAKRICTSGGRRMSTAVCLALKLIPKGAATIVAMTRFSLIEGPHQENINIPKPPHEQDSRKSH